MNDSFYANKRVLITGACGTVGRELVKQLLAMNVLEELIGIDNNESELFFLEQENKDFSNARFFLADVRDKEKLINTMQGIDFVFHAAAFKHVILCERSPFEAVQTNILGVENVIKAALNCKVNRVIFTSSDKAVNPTNVMGTSKLMGERLITAANSNQRNKGPIFASTRFGNVMGSRGSVIPIFREQIRQGGPLTITAKEMTRFIMSIQEAVRLVIDSCTLCCGGEVFVTKMPVIRIQDLAEVMIEELAEMYGYDAGKIKIELIGIKPGEKMYEELMSQEEIRRSWELDLYFVTLPAFTALYRNIEYDYPVLLKKGVQQSYNSASVPPLSKAQLSMFLKENGLLFDDPNACRQPPERFWPDPS